MAEALAVELKANADQFKSEMSNAVASLNNFTAAASKVSQQTNGVGKAVNEIGDSFKGASSEAGALSSAFSAIGVSARAAGIAGIAATFALIATQMIKATEQTNGLRNALSSIRGSATEGADAVERIYQSAKNLGASFDDVAGVTKRLTNALAPLGVSVKDVQLLTDQIVKMGQISGASMGDITTATNAISKAFETGSLKGGDLKKVLDTMPELSRSLAKELGITTAELEALGKKGSVSAEQLWRAMSDGVDRINEKYALLPKSIAASMQNVKTAIRQALDTPSLQPIINGIANAINLIPKAIDKAAQLIGRAATNIGKIFSDLYSLVEPLINGIANLFSGLPSAILEPLKTLGTLLINAFIGPLGMIILNYDKFKIYMTDGLAGTLQLMASYVAAGMADVSAKFDYAWYAIVEAAKQAMNALINAINFGLESANKVIVGLGGTAIATLEPYTEGVFELSETTKELGKVADEVYGKSTRTFDRMNEKLKNLKEEEDAAAKAAEELNKKLGEVPSFAGPAADGLNKVGSGAKNVGKGAKEAVKGLKEIDDAAKEMQDGLKSIIESFGSGLVDSLFAIAEGSKSAKEAFADMAKSMLKQIAQLIFQMLILKPLMNAIFPGGGAVGGLFGGVGRSAGGVTRAFGAAPRVAPGAPIMRAATMGTYGSGIPANQNMMGGNVVVNNYSGAQVKTRQDNNQTIIDIVEEVMVDRITRGGNRVDQAMSRAYGARRVGY